MAGAKGWAQLLELHPIATATRSWASLRFDFAERRQRSIAREKRARGGNLDGYGIADTARPVEGSREMYIIKTHMAVNDSAIMHHSVLLMWFLLSDVGQALPISRTCICFIILVL